MPGRKPLWDEMDMLNMLDTVRGWSIEGFTEAQMCEMLGISRETFYKWKREKSDFADAIRKGRGVASGALVNSAYKQALGYHYTEEMVTPSGAVVEVTKFQQPNASMTMFLLKNWMPDKYRDRRESPAEEKDKGNLDQLVEALNNSTKFLRGE